MALNVRTAAQLRQDQKLREQIRPLWTGADRDVRIGLLTELNERVHFDVADIRAAQPAISMALLDEDPEIALAAASITETRSDEGADIRLAIPSLLLIADHPDARVRRAVWAALAYSDRRHDAMLARIGDLATARANDPDDEVRELATRILTRISS